MSNTLGVEIFMGGRESPIAGQTPSGRYDDDFKAGSSSDPDRPVQPDDLVVLTLPEEINQDEQVRVCKAKDLLPSSVFETFNLATPSGSMTLNVLAGIAKVGAPALEVTTVNATATQSGEWNIYTFTSPTGSIRSNQNIEIEYLIVGGGGAGGTSYGGGGGAGGYLSNVGGQKILLTAGTTYNIVVGEGGLASQNSITNGGNGSKSSLIGGSHNLFSYGGGRGGSNPGVGGNRQSGQEGEEYKVGSGGGGGYGSAPAGLADQGFSSVAGTQSGVKQPGGGGAGHAGYASVGDATGLGGAGLQNAITGTNLYYAAGGNGCGTSQSASVNGIGGMGATPTNSPTQGVDGTGSGGGGGRTAGGANGGSGVVIVRYSTTAQ